MSFIGSNVQMTESILRSTNDVRVSCEKCIVFLNYYRNTSTTRNVLYCSARSNLVTSDAFVNLICRYIMLLMQLF